MATVFAPGRSSPVTSKANRVYAPVTVAGRGHLVAVDPDVAAPITPLTTSVACCPARRRGLKLVRHHHGTANRGTVSAPIWFSYP